MLQNFYIFKREQNLPIKFSLLIIDFRFGNYLITLNALNIVKHKFQCHIVYKVSV